MDNHQKKRLESTENQHQSALIKWTQVARQKYPELKLLYHVPNERKCTPAEGARLKRMGVKRGVPDLCLPVSRHGYSALYIEMKTDTGKTSKEQDWWLEELRKAGNFCDVCHGWDSARRVIEWYLSPAGKNNG